MYLQCTLYVHVHICVQVYTVHFQLHVHVAGNPSPQWVCMHFLKYILLLFNNIVYTDSEGSFDSTWLILGKPLMHLYMYISKHSVTHMFYYLRFLIY